MEVLFLPLLLAIPYLLLRRRAFEPLFFGILLTPMLGFLLGQVLPLTRLPSLGLVLIVQLALVGAAWLRAPVDDRPLQERLAPLLVFSLAYLVFLHFNLQWPDFIAIGERLRDYAILSSVLQSPTEAREPWLVGVPMNYYLYWYRFGQLLAALFDLRTWQVYHSLSAFTSALLLSSCFVFFRSLQRFGVVLALAAALIVVLGSNWAGVLAFTSNDQNWWGPSRVIPGAINEFPAWSFVLGDNHPHFLNLPLLLFLTLVAYEARGYLRSRAERLTALAVGIPLAVLWVYNANAWEVPAFLAVGALLLGQLLATGQLLQSTSAPEKACKAGVAVLLGVGLILLLSLYLSSRNIIPADAPLTLVGGEVPATTLPQLLLHWGIPLVLLSVALVLRLPTAQASLAAGVVGLTVLANSAFLSLLILIALTGFVQLRDLRRGVLSAPLLVVYGFVLGALVLISFPELLFFDDPYGGENERMNTIFKFYAAAWVPLHCATFALLACSLRELGVRIPYVVGVALGGAALACSLGFFSHAVGLRVVPHANAPGAARGLIALNREHPGAAEVITRLEGLPRGVVLEAQGPPYSVTTHVATLSGNDAFLGWQNHVELLTKQYDEIRRRAEITHRVYSTTPCTERRAELQREGIRYVVMGPLERRVFPTLTDESFACLRNIASAGQYRLYEVPAQ